MQELIDKNSNTFAYTKFENLSNNEYDIEDHPKKIIQNFIEVRNCINKKSK